MSNLIKIYPVCKFSHFRLASGTCTKVFKNDSEFSEQCQYHGGLPNCIDAKLLFESKMLHIPTEAIFRVYGFCQAAIFMRNVSNMTQT